MTGIHLDCLQVSKISFIVYYYIQIPRSRKPILVGTFQIQDSFFAQGVLTLKQQKEVRKKNNHEVIKWFFYSVARQLSEQDKVN